MQRITSRTASSRTEDGVPCVRVTTIRPEVHVPNDNHLYQGVVEAHLRRLRVPLGLIVNGRVLGPGKVGCDLLQWIVAIVCQVTKCGDADRARAFGEISVVPENAREIHEG